MNDLNIPQYSLFFHLHTEIRPVCVEYERQPRLALHTFAFNFIIYIILKEKKEEEEEDADNQTRSVVLCHLLINKTKRVRRSQLSHRVVSNRR